MTLFFTGSGKMASSSPVEQGFLFRDLSLISCRLFKTVFLSSIIFTCVRFWIRILLSRTKNTDKSRIKCLYASYFLQQEGFWVKIQWDHEANRLSFEGIWFELVCMYRKLEQLDYKDVVTLSLYPKISNISYRQRINQFTKEWSSSSYIIPEHSSYSVVFSHLLPSKYAVGYMEKVKTLSVIIRW